MSKQKMNELQRSIKELNSDFDENLPTLNRKIKELKNITDDLESMHKATTVGSLVGTTVGAAAGITSLILAPFTFGLSLAVGVGVGGLVGGGVSLACGLTNMIKQKNLLPTIKKIINDFQNIINPLLKHLSTISNIIEEIQKTSNAAPIIVGTVETILGISSVSIDLRMAKIANVATRTAKALQVAGKLLSGLSALLLFADAFFIYQDSTELYEMNQLANKKKAEDIKSDTLKLIHYMRETAAQFQEAVDEIGYTRDTINREKCVNCGGIHM